MSLQGNRYLNPAKLTRVVKDWSQGLVIDKPLIFLSRVKDVFAEDDEITASFRGNQFAADLLAEDAEATVYSAGQFHFSSQAVAKMKIGFRLTESQLTRFARLAQGTVQPEDEGLYGTHLNQIAANLVRGVRQRQNAMICAMMLDAFSYSRYGFQVAGASWGMPSDLKVAAATDWSSTSATPITDILNLTEVVVVDGYGRTYNRITMSRKALRYMVATSEFQSYARGLVTKPFYAADPTFDRFALRDAIQVAGQILDKTVEITDATYAEKAVGGAVTRTRVLPANKVLLSHTDDDNNTQVMDLAKAIVPETRSAALTPGAPDLGGPQVGPVGYFTGDAHLNPGGVVAWAVDKCFPRKHDITATAVITAGSFS